VKRSDGQADGIERALYFSLKKDEGMKYLGKRGKT